MDANHHDLQSLSNLLFFKSFMDAVGMTPYYEALCKRHYLISIMYNFYSILSMSDPDKLQIEAVIITF